MFQNVTSRYVQSDGSVWGRPSEESEELKSHRIKINDQAETTRWRWEIFVCHSDLSRKKHAERCWILKVPSHNLTRRSRVNTTIDIVHASLSLLRLKSQPRESIDMGDRSNFFKSTTKWFSACFSVTFHSRRMLWISFSGRYLFLIHKKNITESI